MSEQPSPMIFQAIESKLNTSPSQPLSNLLKMQEEETSNSTRSGTMQRLMEMVETIPCDAEY